MQATMKAVYVSETHMSIHNFTPTILQVKRAVVSPEKDFSMQTSSFSISFQVSTRSIRTNTNQFD